MRFPDSAPSADALKLSDALDVVRAGFDTATDLAEKRVAREVEYRLLPAILRNAIDAEFRDDIRAEPGY